jgi:hypothetical protein
MKTYNFNNWQLILGDRSRDIFDYFSVEELHGLTLEDCLRHPEPETPGTPGVYIWGLANESPIVDEPPFIFLNMHRMTSTYRDVTTIMHEAMHLSLLLHDYDVDDYEEEIVTWAELTTNEIYPLCLQYQATIWKNN